MRIALIEDEATHREHILKEVRAWQVEKDPEGLAFAYPDAAAFLFAREDQAFDLLIIDILMPGMNGMELARRLRAEHDRTALVFLTGESSYVFAGYKVEALDYLLKPVKTAELHKMLERALKHCRREVPRLMAETEEGLRPIPLNEIVSLEAQNKELILLLSKTAETCERLRLRASLEEWRNRIEEILRIEAGEGFAFAQPHRSYYCNLARVVRVEPELIHLVNGDAIPLARSRRQEFMNAYLRFCRERGRS